jgi:hypothetical protein
MASQANDRTLAAREYWHGLITLPFQWLTAAAIMHASAIFLLWAGIFYFEWGFLPLRWWAMLAWLWVLWPPLLGANPAVTFNQIFEILVIGFALLIPCIPSALAITVWEFGGFSF